MVAAVGVGGLTLTLIKRALRDLSPMTLAAGRVVFSAVAFVAVVAVQPQRRRPVERRDRVRLLACGLAGSAGFHVPFSWGQARVPVVVGAVVLALMPALVAIAEVALLGHRLRPLQVAGIALSLIGVVAVSWGPGGGAVSLAGLAAVAAATLAWAGVTVATRTIAGRYDAWWLNTPGTVVGAVLTTAVAAPRLGELGRLSVGGWVQLAWLGAVSSALVYAALARAMRDLPATTTASLSTLTTPLGVIVAWAVLGERPGGFAALGCAVVVAGVLLTVGRFTGGRFTGGRARPARPAER